jgi:hypothetical protein
MALKKRYSSADEIPEAQRGLYRKEGSGYVLDLDDSGDDDPDEGKGRIGEFRRSNLKLMAELKERDSLIEALRKKAGVIGDHDDETVTTALALLDKVNDQADRELIKSGRFDDVVARRMRSRESDWQKKLDAEIATRKKESEAAAKAREKAAEMLLERSLRAKLAEKKLRLRQSADEDLMLRARRDWKMPDDLEGDPIPASEGGTSDLGAWVDKMAAEKSHWWEGGDGGGTRGSGGGKVVDGVRVVQRSSLSDIEFGKLAGDIATGKVRVVSQ